MKKFLTVLLVIAVMFTFSFGSAFAAEAVDPTVTTTHNEAMAKAEADLVAAFNKVAAQAKAGLADEYKEAVIADDAVIAGSVYATTIDELAAIYAKAVSAAAAKVDKENPTVVKAETLAGLIQAEVNVNTGIVYGNEEIKVAIATFPESAAEVEDYVTSNEVGGDSLKGYLIALTWTNAFESMKAYVNGELNKIDMTLYTDDVADENDPFETTYAQLAAKAKQDKVDVVADTTVNVTMKKSEILTALQKMYAVLDDLIVEETATAIDGSVTVLSYKLANIATAEDLGDDKVVDEATKASLVAKIKAIVASEMKVALEKYNSDIIGATAEQKERAKANYDARVEALEGYEEVNTLLVEEGKIKTEAFFGSDVCADRIEIYEDAEDLAAVLKLQVEKEGSAKYDAAKIDEILKTLKVKIYAGEQTDVDATDFAKALVASSNLAWEKEVAIAALDSEMDGVLYGKCGAAKYYAPEQEKIEAKYAAMVEKINAAETSKQLEKVLEKDVDLTGIDNKTTVNGKVAAHLNTGKFLDAVKSYLDYLNIGVNTYADDYRNDPTREAVAKYLAKEGARTNTDVAAYFAQAEAYAQSVKTNGEIKAAKTAAEEAIKALPNYITVEDKAAVEAAWELADDAGVESTRLNSAVAVVKAAEDKAIDDMVKALPSKLTAADKATVEAIYDAIEEYETTAMYECEDYNATMADKVDKAFEAVRAAALADVHAAIAAVDADDEASVVAAREAVDAFVEEYTDAYEPYQAIAQIKNIDKLTYAEAQVALAKIEAVEALKITAKSSAKKGSITVKWTVKGDTSAVEGYEIWKSTKHSSGYKKAFTTEKMSYKNTKGLKKGTRYYYKVRAIAYVEGEKITSDWSNKARRIAK